MILTIFWDFLKFRNTFVRKKYCQHSGSFMTRGLFHLSYFQWQSKAPPLILRSRNVDTCRDLEQGTRPHSRRWAAGKWAKLHLYLQPLPIARVTAWAQPPVRSAVKLDSQRSTNPTVNCTCEGSRLRAPYENLMPDDLRWSWGSDAYSGERLQTQIIISREVGLQETIINQLLADSYRNPISEWQVKTSSGLPLILHYGELYNYCIIYYNVRIIEIKCTINVMCLNHPKTITPPRAGPWKYCIPRNQSLVPEKAGDRWFRRILLKNKNNNPASSCTCLCLQLLAHSS